MGHVDSDIEVYPKSDHEAAALVLAGIARAIVRSPERVAVESFPEADGAMLTLQVHPDDFEAVVGAGGRTARSLRTVLTALGKRSGQRFSLDIQSQ